MVSQLRLSSKELCTYHEESCQNGWRFPLTNYKAKEKHKEFCTSYLKKGCSSKRNRIFAPCKDQRWFDRKVVFY